MVTRTENVCDFLNELLDKLDVLKKHQFINDQQTKYFYEVKENLPEGKVLCVGDFSQNFSFVYQDAIQGVHWSNTSCTLHPWLCYYRGVEGKVCDYSLLFISDCIKHDTVAVYAFQKKLISCVKEKMLEEGIELTEME